MKTWLDKLCEPLQHPKYPQIRGRLVEVDDKGQITGKCAEGEILCQNNIKFDYNYQYMMMYSYQFEELGVPNDLLYDILPQLFGGKRDNYNISDMIIGVNDAGLSYPEIVEFLRTTFEDAV